MKWDDFEIIVEKNWKTLEKEDLRKYYEAKFRLFNALIVFEVGAFIAIAQIMMGVEPVRTTNATLASVWLFSFVFVIIFFILLGIHFMGIDPWKRHGKMFESYLAGCKKLEQMKNSATNDEIS